MPMPLKVLPNKTCKTCGNQFNRKVMPNGRKQDVKLFLKQEFCSLSCANTRDTLTLTVHGYSFRARKHLKPACEACGHTKSLHAHHVDQDKTNNQAENIQTLCKHCHDFWHTAQKRTGLEVAGRMPPLYGGLQSLMSDELQQGFPIGWANSKATAMPKSRCKPQPPIDSLGDSNATA